MFKLIYSRGWITKVFLAFLAFSFIVGTAIMFGPGSWDLGFGSYAVKVGDVKYTPKEFNLAYANLKRQNPQASDEELKKLAVNQLGITALLAYLAERDGFFVSREEIAAAVRARFSLNGTFDPRLFEEYLRRVRMTPKEFEDLLRKELLAAKYKRALFSTTYADEAVVETLLLPFSLQLNVTVYTLPLEELASSVSVNDTEARLFFEQNRERFAVEEPNTVLIYEVPSKEEVKEIYASVKEGVLPPFKPSYEVGAEEVSGLPAPYGEMAKRAFEKSAIVIKETDKGFAVAVLKKGTRRIPSYEEVKEAVGELVKKQKALKLAEENREELKKKILSGEVKVSKEGAVLPAYELTNKFSMPFDALLEILSGRREFTIVTPDGVKVLIVNSYAFKNEDLPRGEFETYARNAQYSDKVRALLESVIRSGEVKIEVNEKLLGL